MKIDSIKDIFFLTNYGFQKGMYLYMASISSKCYYLFNFTIFTSDPEVILNLICIKYYEICINLLLKIVV